MDTAPWGGSEELWSKTALLLAKRGVRVSASVHGWDQRHPRVEELISKGISVHERKPLQPGFGERMLRRLRLKGHRDLAEDAFRAWLVDDQSDLVVFNDGRVSARPDWGQLCFEADIRYVNLSQANSIVFWPDDNFAEQIRAFLQQAWACFFVSEKNLRLAEWQIGERIDHAQVARNPFSVDFDALPDWNTNRDCELKLAFVGRLEPVSKGQDILFEVLSSEKWKKRSIMVSLFGAGTASKSLERLSKMLGLESMIQFRGHTDSIEEVWKNHDALILPSRHEGLPITIVEAMLCHRAVITIDVGGNAEFIRDGENGFIAGCACPSSLDAAMERAWQNRARFQEMGLKAGIKIRQMIPRCPEQVFSDRLTEIAEKNANHKRKLKKCQNLKHS